MTKDFLLKAWGKAQKEMEDTARVCGFRAYDWTQHLDSDWYAADLVKAAKAFRRAFERWGRLAGAFGAAVKRESERRAA